MLMYFYIALWVAAATLSAHRLSATTTILYSEVQLTSISEKHKKKKLIKSDQTVFVYIFMCFSVK